jgi:hypothetical protein
VTRGTSEKGIQYHMHVGWWWIPSNSVIKCAELPTWTAKGETYAVHNWPSVRVLHRPPVSKFTIPNVSNIELRTVPIQVYRTTPHREHYQHSDECYRQYAERKIDGISYVFG